MKRICRWSLILICMFFLTGCVATNAQKSAGIGSLAGMAGSALGKGDRNTTLLLGGAGAILGYMIGNEMDKNIYQQPRNNSYHQQPRNNSYHQQPRNNSYNYQSRNNSYNYQSRNNSYSYQPRTDCEKIIIRKWVNGQMIETIEEKCKGKVSTPTY